MPRQATFVLVGPNQDKTIDLGGYHFEEGECRVRDAELAQCILRYFSAYETTLVHVLPSGEYVLRETYFKANPAQNAPTKEKPPSRGSKNKEE